MHMGTRRASSGEGHFPARLRSPVFYIFIQQNVRNILYLYLSRNWLEIAQNKSSYARRRNELYWTYTD